MRTYAIRAVFTHKYTCVSVMCAMNWDETISSTLTPELPPGTRWRSLERCPSQMNSLLSPLHTHACTKTREEAWGSATRAAWAGHTSSSGLPVDKARALECRSRTLRNTDGLVSLSAPPLNDLRREIKQEKLPACVCVRASTCSV